MKKHTQVDSQPDLKEARKRGRLAERVTREAMVTPSPFLRAWGQGKKYYLETFGCQMNVRDSEIISGYLDQMGMTQTQDPKAAAIVLLNTCAIRENAETKLYGELGHTKELVDANPNTIVGVCGCMMQLEVPFKIVQSRFPWASLVFGTNNVDSLYSLLEDCIRNRHRVLDVVSAPGEIIEGLPSHRAEPYRAFVNITFGCDKFCTYCIVPFTRGMQRSRKDSSVIAEVRDLVRHGYKEVCLLGQNVSSYGMDLKDNLSFAGLLQAVADTGIARVRFMTSHPHDFTDDVFDVMAKNPNIMPFLHLPVQSGSDHVLKLMNRSYDMAKYLSLVKTVKAKIPDIALSTDIIVGFPGETESDFQQTLDVVKEVQYDSCFTFIFSPRPGTPAYKMVNAASPAEISDRFNRLVALTEAISAEKAQAYVGKTVEVLFLGPSKKDPTMISGYDRHNHLVHVKGDPSLAGQIRHARILASHVHSFIGELLDD